jgi:hypothetical protein
LISLLCCFTISRFYDGGVGKFQMKMENFVKKFAEVEMQTRISVVEG